MSPAQHFEIILYNSGWQWLGLSSLYPSRTLRITSRAPIPGYGVEPDKKGNYYMYKIPHLQYRFYRIYERQNSFPNIGLT